MKPREGIFKLLMIIGLIVALLGLAGCSCKQGQSKLDCLGEKLNLVKEKVCEFNATESDTAQTGLNFISSVLPVVGTVVGVRIDAAQAKAALAQVINVAQKGGCMVLEDLQNALDFVNKLKGQYQELMAKKKMGAFAASMPDMKPLMLKAKMTK